MILHLPRRSAHARPRVPAALVALATALWVAAPQAQNQRAMYVSVVNDQGAPVTDLGPADFVVREDGVVREVLTATNPAPDPMQIALVLDNSQAATPMIQDLRRGAHDFVETMTAASKDQSAPNQIGLFTIADRPTILTDYSSSGATLEKGIDRLFATPGSGMTLLDALIEVIHGIDKRKEPRPVIVAVLTEGIEYSNRYYTDVTRPLADSGATFYAFTVGRPASDLRDETRNRSRVLDEGTRASGGAWEPVVSSMAVPARLAQLADQLTHEYRITYGHPQTLIPPEHVTVEVKRPGLTARGTPVKEQKQ